MSASACFRYSKPPASRADGEKPTSRDLFRLGDLVQARNSKGIYFRSSVSAYISSLPTLRRKSGASVGSRPIHRPIHPAFWNPLRSATLNFASLYGDPNDTVLF